MVCGEFADAANGLIELLQVDEDTLIDKVRGGLEALELEIKMFGDQETIAIFDYVVKQKTSEKEYPNGIRDKGHAGKVRSSSSRRRRRRRVIESF